MSRNRAKYWAVVLAAFVLGGCALAPSGPADPYSPPRRQMSEKELIAARLDREKSPTSSAAARAAYALAREAYIAGDYAEIERQLSWFEQNQPDSPWLPSAYYLKLLSTSSREGDMRMLQSVEQALLRFPDEERFRNAARRLAEPALAACSKADLEQFLSLSPSGPLAPDVLLALGRLNFAESDIEGASAALRRLAADYPESAPAKEAMEILREISRRVPTNPRLIAALLPMTGQFSRFGATASKAIDLAIEDAREAGEEFEFVVFDTQRDPELAIKGLTDLAQERNAIAVFGPLFSATALLCAAEANSLGIVMLTPSALASGLTATGPYVFRSAMTPNQEARAMARFALDRGFERFGILAPDTSYGRELAQSFASQVLAMGGTILAESSYRPESTDYREAIVALGGADISAHKEAVEEFSRTAQSELESFMRDFFRQTKALPNLALSGTAYSQSGPVRVACLILSSDPFSMEIGQRLHAATLPNKSISVLAPVSVTSYSAGLTDAVVTSEGNYASHQELLLAELLDRQFSSNSAALSVLVSVRRSEEDSESQNLECSLAMYDSRLAHRLASYKFSLKRPLPPPGNRFGLEALYVPGTGAQVLQIIPQLVYHNIDLPMFGSETWYDAALYRKPEEVTVQAYFTASFWPKLERPLTRDFVRRYQEKFAESPDSLAANSYDSARLLIQASLHSDGSREGLRQALLESGAIEGVASRLNVAPDRETAREPVILTFTEGNIEQIR